ncbi:MAG: protein kinase [Planctomycetes bacterium]|nr:protein kinase [Planctomycetota bacterium]
MSSTPLDPERFERAASLFTEASGLDPTEWSDYLQEQAPDDGALREEVLSMLRVRCEENDDTFLSRAHRTLRAAEHTEIIGPYRIVRELGSGGMGRVFLAEQTDPVKRPVAIKVIKLGMDSESVLARFEAERQTLARMTSDNIAKVFDAGLTSEGRPYFVMEYVDGVSLTRFCDEHRLSLRDRIRLFQQVCAGTQHAHQKGVIHRDLKPGNILVTLASGSPSAKIIDFGLARAVEVSGGEKLTIQGQAIGTFEYMSPEQAGMPGLDVDTRSDVYALGVILYELLSGELPLEFTDLHRQGTLELQRVICRTEPPTPSERVTADGIAASNRGVQPSVLRRSLRGELDWITMKAIEKDPQRRYQAPMDLAADLDRFLSDDPVVAGPPSAIYQVTKFLSRHRLAVATVIAVCFTAILGGIATLNQQHATVVAMERHRGAIREQMSVVVSRLEGLALDDRWPAQSMTEALTEAERIARDADCLTSEEARSWERQVRSWRRDVGFVRDLDDTILGWIYGSASARGYRKWRSGVDALGRFGVELKTDGGAAWRDAAQKQIEQSRLRSLALMVLNQVRNHRGDGTDGRAYLRATELLELCNHNDTDRRTLYTGKWSRGDARARTLLDRILPSMDPVELCCLLPHLEDYGLERHANARLRQLAIERPASYFVALAQLQRSENKRRRARNAVEKRMELDQSISIARTMQAASPELRGGWVYCVRLLSEAGDPDAENACRVTLRRFHDDPVMLYSLAQLLRIRGRESEARNTYRHLLDVEPGFVEACLALVPTAVPDSPTERAQQIDLMSRSSAADPWHADLALRLAQWLSKQESWSQCIETLTTMLGKNWRCQNAYPVLRNAYERLGQRGNAAACERTLANLRGQVTSPEHAAAVLAAGNATRAMEFALGGYISARNDSGLAERFWSVAENAARIAGVGLERTQIDALTQAEPAGGSGPGTYVAAMAAKRAAKWHVVAAALQQRGTSPDHENALERVCALLWTPQDDDPSNWLRAWTVVEQTLNELHRAVENRNTDPFLVFLELQIWQRRQPLRGIIETLTQRRSAGERLSAADERALRVWDQFKALRERTRPRPARR